MDEKKRLKLCSNCNGQVDIDFEVCPYCGEEFSSMKNSSSLGPNEAGRSLSLEETITSLYPPPYQSKAFEAPVEEERVEEEMIEPQVVAQVKEEEKRDSFVPTLFFSMGLSLLILGIFLLLFSYDGEVSIRWASKFWFLYVLLAAPLIFLGYRALSKE